MGSRVSLVIRSLLLPLGGCVAQLLNLSAPAFLHLRIIEDNASLL